MTIVQIGNRYRGFTLIEILAAVGIILVLATIMIAVGGNVRQNARIKQAHATLSALDGILEKYEQESSQKVSWGTVYSNTGVMDYPAAADIAAGHNAIFTILYRHPATHDMLTKLAGDRLRQVDGASGQYEMLDSFDHPIQFLPAGWTVGSTVTVAAPRSCFRSSGPDKMSNFTDANDPMNNDDILSYEAAR